MFTSALEAELLNNERGKHIFGKCLTYRGGYVDGC
jgi:hypothetical protein